MTRTLAGRRILITGATGSIGRCLAAEAARAGAKLVATARTPADLDQLAHELAPAEVLTVAADVTRPDDRERLLRAAEERFGGLDVLINNAGVGSFGHFATSNESILRQVMELNFFAPAELMRLAVPVLTRGDQPAIVNVSSINGRRALPAWTEYAASKFALGGLTESLRAEFARFEIDVLLIVPGVTRNDPRKHLLRNDGKMDMGYDRGLPPEYVAAKTFDALRSNRKETVLGAKTRWLLRVNRIAPRFLDFMIARRVRKLYAERP